MRTKSNPSAPRFLLGASLIGVGLLSAAVAGAQPPPAQPTDDQGPAAQSPQQLTTVVVTGVRGSEQKSIDLKRYAESIQDSIAAEDIGKLPDTTISDSLQRITGVQIDREGGEGTSVNIRGLPQVGTLLNGEEFITSGSIVSVQPDFGDIPSQLFSGADVIKSSTASLLNTGITGTIDLKTRRPNELKSGWTFSTSAQADHGSISNRYQPETDSLIGYHGHGWGFLLSGSYSDVTLENSVDGMDQYSGEILGETTDSTTAPEGFLNAYLGAPLPAGMTLLHPSQCIDSGGTYSATTPNGCDVDVLGKGNSNAAFYDSPDFSALDRQLERKRTGLNASAQAELGPDLVLTSDFFYTDQQRYNRSVGYQLNTATWNGATFLPESYRDTGVDVYNGFNGGGTPLEQLYTVQSYQQYLGDIETYSEDLTNHTGSRNYNLQLDYEHGNLSADLRGIYAQAHDLYMASYAQFAVSDGNLWPNEPASAAPPGSMVYPGGDRVFDPYGFPANTIPALVNMSGDHLAITLPSGLQQTLTNENAYSLKTIASENDYDRSTAMKVVRADGHYKLGDSGYKIDFGVRHSDRSADNTNFELIAPVYGNDGAYNNVVDPATGEETSVEIPNSVGCYVRYKGADVILDGGGIPGACKAGSPVTGYYRAGALSAQNPSQLPSIFGSNMHYYGSLADVSGMGLWDMDPSVMDNVLAFQNALYPGEIRNIDPGGTWRVDLGQTTGYFQGDFNTTAGSIPIYGNVGFKVMQTSLGVDQHKVGAPGAYFVNAADLGITHTQKSFTDVLPAVNVAFDLRDNLKLRLAYAKNMQILDLDQWGGGLTLNYAIVAGSTPPVFAVIGGSETGNPNLKPWRSSNYDASLEYYMGQSSMVSLALFYVDVASFIDDGSVVRCDLPDEDGVVRNRCVAIDGPIQGSGKSLRGVEFGLKQAFTFLPGLLSNLGTDANFTFSPSNVGTDVAGNAIPFQDNSAEQANLILWYQSHRFQARLAGNYRSKRAVSQNYGGLTGFEEYQAPTLYLDASISYDITSNFQVFLEGSNLTGEEEHYYLVWPDQKLDTTRFESRYALGMRASF